MSHLVSAGVPSPLGVTVVEGGVNVAVWSAHADAIDFCLFDEMGSTELQRHRLARTGDVFHARIDDVAPGARYGLRAHGPWAPSDGHRFDSSKLLVDPYALELDRPFTLHPSMFSGAVAQDSAAVTPKAIVSETARIAERAISRREWPDTVLYELHVRGFTKLDPDVPQPLRGTFAGLAHPSAIARLTRLGVTCVEIMPCAAWIDERHLGPLGLTNYWGYNPIAMMTPDPKLAPGGWREVRESVAALHAAGLEVIIDVVFNHTGEGDEFGPTLSMRGLDNASYYRLIPDAKDRYINDAGCGNCLALDRTPSLQLALDSLRAWALYGGVDGFRFDLATALGRRPDGFDPSAPLIVAIEQDDVLKSLKLVAEPWDIGPGGYQVGAFSSQWAEWNDRYRDDVRRFWKGDTHMLGALATRFAGSSDLFGQKTAPSRSVNFITAHDGFTLRDLVSYNHKHNDANGEHNRDGGDQNHSWNRGLEGPTDDAGVLELRKRDERNMLATLLLSRGTPMLSMGAETGHTQGGNNNAYAQNNAISWIDWSRSDDALTQFVADLVAFRAQHPALTDDRFLTGAPVDHSGVPDVEWLGADGRRLSSDAWNDPATQTLMISLYAPAAPHHSADRVLIVMHRSDAACALTAPEAREMHRWKRSLDTSGFTSDDNSIDTSVAPHSVAVFCEVEVEADSSYARRSGTDHGALDRLATAAGISSVWWEVNGTRHEVTHESKIALLDAMRIDARSTTAARESLSGLAQTHDLRALPHAIAARVGDDAHVHLPLPQRQVRNARWLRIEREDGLRETYRIDADALRGESAVACDGRAFRLDRFRLPLQPAGRHRLWLDGSDASCLLTVAPQRCHVPDFFEEGSRRFGLAAHLYALRDADAHGVGDFGTLSRFARLAGLSGASTVGLNPLHAMFAEQRERASPYQPSHRSFVDPIYIDLRQLEALAKYAQPSDFGETIRHALNAGASVDYPAVWALKKSALEACFAAFETACANGQCGDLRTEFEEFIGLGGAALDRFARHETIAETMPGLTWPSWPASLQDCDSDASRAFVAQRLTRHRFHLFLQWLCDRQLDASAHAASRAGLSLGFLGDLAVGMAPDGAEAWGNRGALARGVSVGAPPDPLGPDGQNWGLPPLDPLRLAPLGFAPFIDPIAANMRHAGVLRIDHVLGLARLFWIPDGAKAGQGAYISYPVDHLIGQIALESTRNKCLIVGEDLGTVPEGLTEKLSDATILSYRVLWFEREGEQFRAPASYPARALACVSTHDLPTLRGWWSGEDHLERRRLGLMDDAALFDALANRAHEKREVIACLARSGFPASPDTEAPLDLATAAALHAFLASSPSWLMLAQADDLAGESIAVNLPGTDRERPNWRRRIELDVDQMFDSDLARRILAALSERAVGAPSTAASMRDLVSSGSER